MRPPSPPSWRPACDAGTGVIAALEVVVEGARVVRLSATPPLAAKVLDGPSGPELLLVGAAASLLEGDRLSVRLRLGAGATLTVRAAAATIAHPCPGGGATAFDVEAVVGHGARLAWLPEPLVACAGCRHAGRSRLRLDRGAVAVWCETVALGRTGEQPGDVALRLDVDLEGVPLLREGLRAGPSAPGWDGPAVLAGARHAGTVALLGPADLPGMPSGDYGRSGGALRLAGPGAVVRAVGADGAGVERMLSAARHTFLAALHAGRPAQATATLTRT